MDDATCQRCQQLLLVRARNQAYRVALRIMADCALTQVAFATDKLLRDGMEAIAEELRLRADGQLLARPIGPEILKRAGERTPRGVIASTTFLP